MTLRDRAKEILSGTLGGVVSLASTEGCAGVDHKSMRYKWITMVSQRQLG